MADAGALTDLQDARTVRFFEINDNLAAQGEPAPAFVVSLEGWLVLEASLEDGRKAVIEVAPPGTVLCLHTGRSSTSIYSVVGVTQGRACMIRAGRNTSLRLTYLDYDRMLIEEAERCRMRLADRLLTVTTRDAKAALARFLMEMFVRATRAYPPKAGDAFAFPLTQTHLAEALGHTPVYINRLVRELREGGVVAIRRGELLVLDASAFVRMAGDAGALLDAWGLSVAPGHGTTSAEFVGSHISLDIV